MFKNNLLSNEDISFLADYFSEDLAQTFIDVYGDNNGRLISVIINKKKLLSLLVIDYFC